MLSVVRQIKKCQLLRRDFVRNCSNAANSTTKKDKCTYDKLLKSRQLEATRSIVIQVSSEKSFPELYNYCKSFGNIKSAQHYKVQHEEDHHYILLEYSSADEAAAAIDASTYNIELTGVPVRSPFLWFKANGKRKLTATELSKKTVGLCVVDGNRVIENTELNALLMEASNIEDQIKLLHQYTQLNDIGIRLRFLAALQVQRSVSGMFPYANAQPFGSSVNGFGRMGCDLDLILRLDKETVGNKSTQRSESRLVFHTKENLTNGRSQTQRQMESIGDMLHLFLPGVCHVRRILQARVPIIKYHHEHLDLEVDLSMSNLTGFYMSELLYMFGELDERVRPLMFCIRRWANSCGLTNRSPGRWITNFSLTCLVIFFLQRLKQPVLPTINAIFKAANAEDIRVTEDGINCTFGRNFEQIGIRNQNKSKVNELLLQFFEFYSQFDFVNRAISLNEGHAIAKPDHSALYIVNPLEQVLNVSKNVSLEECERLRIEVRNAAWILESEVENTTLLENDKLSAPWGILNLFKTSENSIIRPNMFFKPRLMEVRDLFDKTNPIGTTKSTSTNETTFKNSNVKQQVQNIKAQAQTDLQQMHINATNSTETRSKRSKRSR